MSGTAWLLLFALGFVWGGSFFCAEILLLTMSPFHIVFFRVAIAALAMLVFIHARGKRLPTDAASWLRFAVMGLFNNALPFSCIVFGQQYITGGLAAILNSSTAFIAVIMSGAVFQDERVTVPRLVGTMLGVGGVTVTIGVEHLSTLTLASIGQLLIIVASVSYAIASIFGRLQVNNHGVQVTATGMLIASAAWMLLLSLWVEGVPTLSLDTPSVLAILAYAIPCTSLAYLLYFALLREAGSANTMLVTIVIPPFALLLDALAIGELVGPREVLGFLIIALGLLILSGKIPLRPRALTRRE